MKRLVLCLFLAACEREDISENIEPTDTGVADTYAPVETGEEAETGAPMDTAELADTGVEVETGGQTDTGDVTDTDCNPHPAAGWEHAKPRPWSNSRWNRDCGEPPGHARK